MKNKVNIFSVYRMRIKMIELKAEEFVNSQYVQQFILFLKAFEEGYRFAMYLRNKKVEGKVEHLILKSDRVKKQIEIFKTEWAVISSVSELYNKLNKAKEHRRGIKKENNKLLKRSIDTGKNQKIRLLKNTIARIGDIGMQEGFVE